MTYYIVGKKTLDGTLASDSANGVLSEYFELGWEYAVSHLHIKHLHSIGTLQSDDVIVTLKDRMFLYEGFWKNVMAYETFKDLKLQPDCSVVDLCDEIQMRPEHYLPSIGDDGKYIHWKTMRNIILNINYVDIKHLNTKKPFCCLHIRYRGWAKHRNISEQFWHTLINDLVNTGINIYIFGKEATRFANGDNIKHVSLSEYASLCNNSSCKFVLGSMSGGTLVAQTFAHKDCKQYVLITDHQTLNEYNTNDPYKIFYHIDGMNFSQSPTKHIIHFSNESIINQII